MCTVSNLGDDYARRFPDRWPNVPIYPSPAPWVAPPRQPSPSGMPHPFEMTQDAIRECVVCGHQRSHWLHAAFEPAPEPAISKKDFDALKAEIEELKKLLLAAKRFDEATDQPECHDEEKIALIRQIADLVGVDVDEVFGSRDQ